MEEGRCLSTLRVLRAGTTTKVLMSPGETVKRLKHPSTRDRLGNQQCDRRVIDTALQYKPMRNSVLGNDGALPDDERHLYIAKPDTHRAGELHAWARYARTINGTRVALFNVQLRVFSLSASHAYSSRETHVTESRPCHCSQTDRRHTFIVKVPLGSCIRVNT